MGVDYITFGGVELRKNEIKNKEIKTVTHSDGQEEQVYVVNFKNGVSVSYRGAEDAPCFKPYISSSNASSGFAGTNVYGVLGLELHGSKGKEDSISIVGGSLIGVDVANDNKSDEVRIYSAKVEPHKLGILGDGSLYEGQVRVEKDDVTIIKQVGDVGTTHEGSIFTKKGLGVHRVLWR